MWIWAEGSEFTGNTIPFFCIGGRQASRGDVWPSRRIVAIELRPFLQSRLSIRLDSLSWTFRFANAAIDTFIGVDHQHVLAGVKAVNGTNLDAIHVFTLDAILGDDVGHSSALLVAVAETAAGSEWI